MLHCSLSTDRWYRRLMCAAFLATITPLIGFGQAERLKVINKTALLRQHIHCDRTQQMVSLKGVAPSIFIDLKYATPENFTGKQLYPSTTTTYLRLPAARAIAAVQQALAAKGMGLKIWDAYRPYEVTRRMWQLIGDERYVANPAKGSGHNRGIAVDLTIIDLKTGKELDMGTPFDHFSEAAHHTYNGLTSAQLEARTLLKTLMEQHGFKALSTEWWHYSWSDAAQYPVLDLSFPQLAKLAD